MKGYRVRARRYKTPVGEVDLVVEKGDELVFVEVKARAELDQALLSITPRMKKRICRAADYYLTQRPVRADKNMRFDVVAVAGLQGCKHVANAWEYQG